MNSSFLTKIGLGGLDLGIVMLVLLILFIAIIVLLIINLVQNKKLKDKYDLFMQGADAYSLEEQIQALIADVAQLGVESDSHYENIQTLYNKHAYSFQKMGLIKYDAYKEMGGKLSYALTLLDEDNNGFLTNSVHSSSGCYSYTKRIKNGKCDLNLSPEEKASLDKAVSTKIG